MKPIVRNLSLVLTLLVVAVILLVLAAPAIGIYFADRWYRQQGTDYRLEVGHWDFSPMRLKLVLDDLKLQHPGQGSGETRFDQLSVDLSLGELFSHRVHVRSLKLDGLEAGVSLVENEQGKTLSVAGLQIPLGGNNSAAASTSGNGESEPWSISLDRLQLKKDYLSFSVNGAEQAGGGTLTLDELNVWDFSTDNTQPVQLQLQASVNALQLTAPDTVTLNQPLAIEVKGALHNALSEPQWQGDVQLEGVDVNWRDQVSLVLSQLTLAGIDASAVQQSLQTLTLNGVGIKTSEGEQVAVSQLSLAGLTLDEQKKQLDTLALEGISLSSEAQQAELSLEKIALSGLGENDQGRHLDTLEVDGINARSDLYQLLLTLNNLSLSGVNSNPVQSKLAWFNFHDLNVSSGEHQVLALAYYQLENIDYSDALISVGDQIFNGLNAQVKRRADGSIVGMPVIAEQPAQPQAATEAGPTSELSFEQKLRRLSLVFAGLQQVVEDAAANGKILVNDASVKPAFSSTVTVHEFTIGKVSPDLSGKVPALQALVPVHMLLGLDEYNRIKADGDIGLYQRDGEVYPQGEMRVKAEQLDLVAFNGYLNQAMGYQVERGMMDIDADIKIDKAKLSGEVKILLRNSRFVPSDEETIARVSKQISMPVDTALDLLRDDNGNVRLTIPLSGDLSNPDVGLNDLTTQLSKLALQKGAVFYLKQSLQPYTTMITVASYAGDYLFAIRLDALSFEKGISDLTDAQKPRVENVAKLMAKKPDLELRVCPFVSKTEATELGEGWSALATARAQNVKALLATYTDINKKSLASRVTLCKAQKGDKAEVVMGVD